MKSDLKIKDVDGNNTVWYGVCKLIPVVFFSEHPLLPVFFSGCFYD